MFSILKRKRQQKLNADMYFATVQRDWPSVEKFLAEGADAKVHGFPPHEPQLPLACAVERRAPLSTINALLAAGADVQEPYRWQAIDWRLSEIAEWSKCAPEVIARVKEAEAEAEKKNGPRALDRKRLERKTCGVRPFF